MLDVSKVPSEGFGYVDIFQSKGRGSKPILFHQDLYNGIR
jgi:hypothetical protein